MDTVNANAKKNIPIVVSGFKMEKVQTKLFPGKEVIFVRQINHNETREKTFPGVTLGCNEVDSLYEENPNKIGKLLAYPEAYVGLAVRTEKPLAEHIDKNGQFSLTAYFGLYDNEVRTLTIVPGAFEKANIGTEELSQNGKMLLISKYYTATADGHKYTFYVPFATLESMQLSEKPYSGEFAGMFSKYDYNEYKSNSGDVLGSAHVGYFSGRLINVRTLTIGDKLTGRRGVFMLADTGFCEKMSSN